MGQVTGYTAARMKEIEDASVVNAEINAEDHLIFTRHDGSEIDAGLLPSADSANIGLIAVKSIEVAGDVTATAGVTALSDVDAANMFVTFEVPDSGKVLVRLSGLVRVNGGTAGTGGALYWGLREGAVDVGDAAGQLVWATAAALSSQQSISCTVAILVTGLTPGATKTYKWAHRNPGTGTYQTHKGSTTTAVMEVIAVP